MEHRVREHLQQLAITSGGGIISEKVRTAMINSPVLVVGLGGTGIDALLRVKYMVNRRFQLPRDQVTNEIEDKPRNIEFLGIETNYPDMDKRYPSRSGIGLNSISEFMLLSHPCVQAILRNQEIMHDSIKEWLSPELAVTPGNNSPAGVRQLGRLLLFTKITEVIEKIERKINLLMRGRFDTVQVFILTGLTGGTGSGCFLDTAYIIREIVDRLFGSLAPKGLKIHGYLFTPDVNLSREHISGHQRDHMIVNGYAALKELDYWMNAGERGERFTQNYCDHLTVNTLKPPFDICNLISAYNMQGIAMENAYDCCLNIAAESIFNFIVDEKKEREAMFTVQDYMCDAKMIEAAMKKSFKANYQYSILGASSVALPVDEITTYLAGKVFEKILPSFNAAPSQAEVEEFLRKLKLNKEAVEVVFNNNIREPLTGFEQNPVLYSYDNVIKSDNAHVMEELNSCIANAEEQYMYCARNLPKEFISNVKAEVERLFVDSDKGPFFVQRLICFREGYDFGERLRNTVSSIDYELGKISGIIYELENISLLKYNDAKCALLFSRERRKNEYLNTRKKEFKAKAHKIKLEYMRRFYEEVTFSLQEYNYAILAPITEIFNKLNKIFKENNYILTLEAKEKSYFGSRLSWSLIDLSKTLKELDAAVAGRRTDELLVSLNSKLLKSLNSWIDQDKLAVVDFISEYISSEFEEVITKPMDDYLREQCGDYNSIRQLCMEVVRELERRAVPLFYMDNNIDIGRLPGFKIVSVPANSPLIREAINDYLNYSYAKHTVFVKESMDLNRISWVSSVHGVPLYLYTPLRYYEEVYEEAVGTISFAGRHLSQSSKADWALLPSPIPEEIRKQPNSEAQDN